MTKIVVHNDYDGGVTYDLGKSSFYVSVDVPQKLIDKFDRAQANYYNVGAELQAAYEKGLPKKVKNRMTEWRGVTSAE